MLVYCIYLGLTGVPISSYWRLCKYYTGTWTLRGGSANTELDLETKPGMVVKTQLHSGTITGRLTC